MAVGRSIGPSSHCSVTRDGGRAIRREDPGVLREDKRERAANDHRESLDTSSEAC